MNRTYGTLIAGISRNAFCQGARGLVGAALLVTSSLGLQAQQAPQRLDEQKDVKVVELETFKVEGSLLGQAKANAATRDAPNLINVISSDKMGTFPDLNAAEALGRLPGISVIKEAGEGRFISIRGARPQYNGT